MNSWLATERIYEGFPFFLRRPVGVDTPENWQRFPNLVVITHTFTERLPDGRPEPKYNGCFFDCRVHHHISSREASYLRTAGQCLLDRYAKDLF